jgi:hypothetical protein
VATGNRYAAAVNRTRPYHSVSQKVYLQNDTHYTLSGLASHSCSVFFFFFWLAISLKTSSFACSLVSGEQWQRRRRAGGRQDRR